MHAENEGRTVSSLSAELPRMLWCGGPHIKFRTNEVKMAEYQGQPFWGGRGAGWSFAVGLVGSSPRSQAFINYIIHGLYSSRAFSNNSNFQTLRGAR